MSDLRKAHQTMQENCGINVGDTVRVLRKAETQEMGWTADWNPDMDKCIGKQGVVTYIHSSSAVLGIEVLCWNFPFFVLEKVKDAEPQTTRDKVMALLEDSDLGCGKDNIIEAVGLIMDEIEDKK